MKILNLYRNEAGQIIAEVLNCGKIRKIFASSIAGLIDAINKNCYFTNKDEIKLDLELNYSDFV